MIEGIEIQENPTAIRFLKEMLNTELSLTVGVVKNPYQRKKVRMGHGLGTRQISLLKVAEFHELGRGQIKRSFLASTFSENKKQINKDLMLLVKKAGKTKRQSVMEPGLRKLGAYLSAKVKRKFFGQNNWAALSRHTRPRDPSRKPLVATHQLANSIGYVVVKGRKL